MTRPNFFIVGAPKCGTTAWVDYLSTHPDIAFSTQKEPHYFNTDFPDFRWAKTEDAYLREFKDAGHAKRVGEGSVQYLYSQDAAQNIAKFCPDAKIVIFLREPAAFLRSYHNQLLLNLDENIEDFAKAWALSGKRSADQISKTCREPKFLNYKKAAKFSEQVARYRAHFAADQIKIMWFDEWSRAPRQGYLDLMDFLDLKDDGRVDFPVVHSAKRNASERMARVVQRPPGWALRVSAVIKRVLGIKRLGLVRHLRKMNTRTGYADASRDESLATEISDYFAADYSSLRAANGPVKS